MSMKLDRRALIAAPAGLAACANAGLPRRPPQALLPAPERAPDEVIPLWPDRAPGSEDVDVVEIVVERDNRFGLLDRAAHNVTRPTLSRFDAANADGSALIIVPGGGYAWVVIDKEGFEGARWFARQGVTVYVMTHRLPHQGWAAGADTPLQDAQRAVRLVRSRAARDGIDPDRVSVMGFSAGGHVAGSLATRFGVNAYAPIDAADAQSARPSLAALMYPVITMREPHAHAGSRRNLLGEAPAAERVAAYSLETAPPADTPPTFLMHAADDVNLRNMLS